MPYGTKQTLSWKGIYDTCAKITNIAYVNTRGITGNQYGVCYDINCGTVPACVAPTSVTTSPKTVNACVGQKATLHGAYVLGTGTNYRYVWYKKGSPPTAPSYRSSYSDSVMASVTAATAGTYVLRVADGTDGTASCYLEDTVHLVVNPLPTALITNARPISYCSDKKGVTLTAQAVAGAGYQWYQRGVKKGTDSSALANADSGSYTLRVTLRATGCSDSSAAVPVLLLPQPLAAIDPSGSPFTYCQGGTGLTLSALGAGSGASYQWLLNGSPTGPAGIQHTGSAAGPWSVVAKGANGCTDTSAAVTVTASTSLALSILGDTLLCPGDSLRLGTNLGSTVTWTLPDKSTRASAKLSLIAVAGTYRAAYSDPSGCKGSDSVLVSIQNPSLAPTVSVSSDKPFYCKGEKALFTAVPANAVSPTYIWYLSSKLQLSTSDTLSATPSDGDTVRVSVSSSGSCSSGSAADTLVAAVRAVVPRLRLKPVSDTVCTGERVDFSVGSASGAGTVSAYDWYVDGAKNVTAPGLSMPIPARTTVYAVLTSDAACASPATAHSDTLAVEVRGSVTPSVEISADRTALCSGDRSAVLYIVRASGTGTAPSYQWLVNKGPIAGATGDTLRIAANDGDLVSLALASSSPCRTRAGDTSNTVALSVQPSVAASVSVSLAGIGGLGCEGDTAHLTATATPGTVTWSNGQTGPTAAVYGWANGDRATAVLSSSAACASPASPTGYVVLAGRARTTPVPAPTVLPDQALPLCPGTVSLSAPTGLGSAYRWTVGGAAVSTDSVYAPVLAAGAGLSGTVAVASRGCFPTGADSVSTTLQFTFTVAGGVGVALTGKPVRVCAGGDATVLANGTGAVAGYDWYVGGWLAASTAVPTAVLPGLAQGDLVRVVARAAVSCPGLPASAADSATVRADAKPVPGFAQGPGPFLLCDGHDTTITALEGDPSYAYAWSPDPGNGTGGTNSLTASLPGDYTLTVTNGACVLTETATIGSAGPTVHIEPRVTEFSPGDPVALSAQVGGNTSGLTYLWTPAQLGIPPTASPTFLPTETGFAKLTVTNALGCSAKDSVLLQKVDKLFIPNAITPETADQNAFWNIRGAEAYPDLDVRVYNRWGSLVHEQRGYASPWDGTLNGKPLPTATYYYVIKHKKLDKTRVGDLTIVR